MKRIARAAMFAAMAACVGTPASAQQKIEWKQVTNLPKGLNLPSGVKADILGIELGDSYAEAKAKLQKLQAEDVRGDTQDRRTFQQKSQDEIMGVRRPQPFSERSMQIRLRAGPTTEITASYVGIMQVDRQLKGASNRNIEERITIHLSAPSSGHQVVAIERYIHYPTPQDHPLRKDVLAQVSQKFRAETTQYAVSKTEHRIQYAKGKIVAIDPRQTPPCYGSNSIDQPGHRVNQKGDCDILLFVNVHPGVSAEHASSITFKLHDHERLNANTATDFGFFDSYVKSLQNNSAAPPKL